MLKQMKEKSDIRLKDINEKIYQDQEIKQKYLEKK